MAVDIAMKILSHLKIFQLLKLHISLRNCSRANYTKALYLPQHRQQVFD